MPRLITSGPLAGTEVLYPDEVRVTILSSGKKPSQQGIVSPEGIIYGPGDYEVHLPSLTPEMRDLFLGEVGESVREIPIAVLHQEGEISVGQTVILAQCRTGGSLSNQFYLIR